MSGWHTGVRSLSAVCRAMKELVDGPCHEAWSQVASGLLPAGAACRNQRTGEEWQALIRCSPGSMCCRLPTFDLL